MNANKTIQALAKLGKKINAWIDDETQCSELLLAANAAIEQNKWFTRQNINKMLASISAQMFDEQKLNLWFSKYNFTAKTPKRVGIIAAGNLPLVFFHDFICVIISGNIAVIKLSSKDNILPRCIFKILMNIEPQFANYIEITEQKTPQVDAVIATGSQNTNNFFEAEFGSLPHIFRSSRTSAAIIKGNETSRQLTLLGDDMFSFFGLGCRNVNTLIVPQNYNFEPLISAVSKFSDIKNHIPYANSYIYNKALLSLTNAKFTDNGFWILEESTAFFSPVSVIYYQTYKNDDEILKIIDQNKNSIQCVVNVDVDFGEAQNPELTNYADGIDIMEFLENI